MSYLWGDLGVVPSESCFSQHGLISLHYAKSGGFYPVGGASEFALSMIPIVERAGGKVQDIQGSAKRWSSGCVNAAGKARQKYGKP